MIVLFGSIPLGVNALTGPTARQIDKVATFVEHEVTRGKKPLQEIGEENDRQSFDFFFSEEFCAVPAELAKLETAFALKTPLPLVLGSGVYLGKRYVVESLTTTITKTDRSGNPVRVDATIGLLEDPIAGGLFSLITSIAKSRAPALAGRSANNPNLRR